MDYDVVRLTCVRGRVWTMMWSEVMLAVVNERAGLLWGWVMRKVPCACVLPVVGL